MIFEERLAELGVETRDLVLSDAHCMSLYKKFDAEAERICEKTNEELDAAFMVSLLLVEVAKRDDVIDRMETRIENLTGERDYLFERASDAGVLDCADCIYNGEDCNDRCYDGTGLEHGVWAGVPEDWRPTADEP